MIAAGFEAWHHVRELSVRGYVEVLRAPAAVAGAAARPGATRCCASGRPCFVGVDAPDFNLGWRSSCAAAACRSCTTSARRSGHGAAGASSTDPPRSRPHAAGVSVREADLREAGDSGDLRRPSAGEHDSAGARSGAGARASSASPGGATVVAAARQSRARGRDIAPVLLGADGAACARATPSMRFVLPAADAGTARALDAHAGRRCCGACRVTSVVDGRSHDCLQAADVRAGRKRHRDARGGAVQSRW